MRVVITGATGLIGSALGSFLAEQRWDVARLVRTPPRPGRSDIFWDPHKQVIDSASLEGCHTVVHLAGENLASGRWTEEKKRRIRGSRVNATTLLAGALAKLQSPPAVFASASAVGYYGDRRDEILTEESPPGDGFLAAVCREWEAATFQASQSGIRVAQMRFGVVLSRHGGALVKMLPIFKAGLGGTLGNGRQYWSWIAIDDLVRATQHVLTSETLAGPINFVAPQPVTNREFTRTLARALSRPALLPAPRFALRLALGEMADAALLASARVQPRRLLDSGFQFHFPRLAGALEALLKGPNPKRGWDRSVLEHD